MNLRSATQTSPVGWRQWARRGLVTLAPCWAVMASGPADSNSVCLSFDDGPDPRTTPAVLAALRSADIRASFFVQGAQAAAHPELLRALHADGHDLGHHSWSHGSPAATSAAALIAETRRTRKFLRETTGVESNIFRPPHGKLTPLKAARLWAIGQCIVLWSLDPGDVRAASAADLIEWFAKHPPSAGDIVLLHDTAPMLSEALPEIVRAVRGRGLGFATVSEWLNPASPPHTTRAIRAQ